MKHLESLFTSIFLFFIPAHPFIFILLTLVLCEMIYEVIADFKIYGYDKYKGKIFKYFWSVIYSNKLKMLFYTASILLFYSIDFYILNGISIFGIELILTKFISLMWIYVEIKSIDDSRVKCGKQRFVDIFKNFIKSAMYVKDNVDKLK